MKLLFLIFLCTFYTSYSFYPYGCAECKAKGGYFCKLYDSSFKCYETPEQCTNDPTSRIVSDCSQTSSCYDHNYDCAKCTSTPGCIGCAASNFYCVPGNQTCFGTAVTSAQCNSKLVTCSKNLNCSTCLADTSCTWCSEHPSYQYPAGCSGSSTCYGAVTTCDTPKVYCPLRSNNFENRCNCATDKYCNLCYGFSDPDHNFKCYPNAQYTDGINYCTNMYSNCNHSTIVCPSLLNSYDPYGTRCACISNPACSLCLQKPPNDLKSGNIYCVDTSSPPNRVCEILTRDCQDPLILCPTKLSCDTCMKDSNCAWCESGDIAFPPKCIANSKTCPTATVKATTCVDSCPAFTDCNSCQTAGCKWCYSPSSGSVRCNKICDGSVDSLTVISDCTKIDPCTTYTSCSSCTSNRCTFCEGRDQSSGRNYGNWCTNKSNCGNQDGCNVWAPCKATAHKNCSAINNCNTFKDCLSCVNQLSIISLGCNWCDDHGTRYCSNSCPPGSVTPTCAVFGPTTTGLPLLSGGETGAVSTGSNGGGGSPPTGIPSGSAPPSGTSPSGTSPSGISPSGGTGNTPSGTSPSGTSPSGTSPSGTSPSGTSPSGTSPSGTSPSGDTPSGTSPSGTTPSGTTPGGSGNTPSGTSPSGTSPSGTSPSGTSPSGSTPSSTGNTPSGTNPAGNPSAPRSPSDTNSQQAGGGTSNGDLSTPAIIGIVIGVVILVVIIIVIVVIVIKKSAGGESV